MSETECKKDHANDEKRKEGRNKKGGGEKTMQERKNANEREQGMNAREK